MSKKRRFEPIFHHTRPIDKDIIIVNQSGVTATQVAPVIKTAAFPCTMTGLRWDLNFHQDAGTGLCIFQWAIVFLGEAQTVDALSLVASATLYEPEQDVLTWGIGSIQTSNETKDWRGTTKTMRKMKVGDRLVFLLRGIATETVAVLGAVQFFCKT